MRRLFLLLLCTAVFSACKKDASVKDDRIITDPPFSRLVSSDTLKTGGKMGLGIGMSGAEIYAKIQQVKAQENIPYVNVVNNVFYDLAAVANSIPLYQSVYLDEMKGTGTGIQITFGANKVKVIYTNDGVKLDKWPSNTPVNATVAVGDAVDDVYQKLVNIKQMAAYSNKFQRISIFTKDVDKGYDAHMAASPQWYFYKGETANKYNLIRLYFTNGILSSIITDVFEY